jgi:hypothetical protein
MEFAAYNAAFILTILCGGKHRSHDASLIQEFLALRAIRFSGFPTVHYWPCYAIKIFIEFKEKKIASLLTIASCAL